MPSASMARRSATGRVVERCGGCTVRDGPLVALTMEMVASPHGVLVVIAHEFDLSTVDAAAAGARQLVRGDVELDLGGPGVRGFRRCPHAARRASPSERRESRSSVDTSSGAVRRTFVITGDPCDDPTSPGSTQESERVTSEDRNLDGPDLTTNERALARVLRLRRSVPGAGASLRWRRGDGGQRDVEAVTGLDRGAPIQGQSGRAGLLPC